MYVVDITPSLCQVAVERFKRLGWQNVKVQCVDALEFQMDEEDQLTDGVEIGLVTMSYSLSMFPQPYAIVDKCRSLLTDQGLMGVADFHVSPKHATDETRQHSWLTRLFW